MEDLQASGDHRNVTLERVGITKLALPVMILEQAGGYQHVTASASMFVEVPASVRGTHLSRFVELLHEWADSPVSSVDVQALLESTTSRAGSNSAEVTLSFRFFLRKSAPISGKSGMVDYGCEFHGRLDRGRFRFVLGVTVPVTTACPCSKAISDYGAHNQRALVAARIECTDDGFVWIEDLIQLIEEQASCPVFSILKREDEKWVTERSYENAKFVEDVTRDVAIEISRLVGVSRFRVRAESIESIHNHNAVASVGWSSVTRGDLALEEISAVST